MATKQRSKGHLHNCYPRRRTLTGCLTCRRRKKKCDETRPNCKGCTRNFLKCEWSLNRKNCNDQTLSFTPGDCVRRKRYAEVNFSISLCRATKFVTYTQDSDWEFLSFSVNLKNGHLFQYDTKMLRFIEIDDFPLCCEETCVFQAPSPHKHSPRSSSLPLKSRSHGIVSEVLDLHLEPSRIIDAPIHSIEKYPSHERSHYKMFADANVFQTTKFDSLFQMCKLKEPVPEKEFVGVDMENFLFYSCLKGYIPKMTTQYTHVSLTMEATFIPQVEKNPIMMEVFLCCGATYLAWNNLQRFQNMSDELYINCKSMICDHMKNNEKFADEDWLFAALQLMCNRDKNSLTGTTDDAMWHLVRSYDIIRVRYYVMRRDNFEHALIEELINPSLILQPQERTLIESFIYQYSVSVLFVRNFKGLPSPFEIFKILNVVLKCPVYNCENTVDWMHNPILGSSLDSFEILAKLSFIGRRPRPLDQVCLEQVIRLRSMCEYYTSAAPSKPMEKAPWHNYKINSIVGIVTAKACWLFASKILKFESFDAKELQIQETVENILKQWEKIPVGHNVWGILPWTLLVTGVFVTDEGQRSTVLEYVEIWSERTHSYNAFKIASFLRKAWASDDPPGLLFDRTQLNNVSM